MLKPLSLLLLAAITLPAVCQNVNSINVHFRTTDDGKDGDTQVRDRIVCNGEDYATLYCCSAGTHSAGDIWDKYSDKDAKMRVITPIPKSMIAQCIFVAGELPVGKDKWDVIESVTFNFDDNSSPAEYSFPEISLFANGSLYEVKFPLKR